MNFPDRLRKAREERNYSQTALAEAAGLSRRQIQYLEAGTHDPGPETRMALAAVLGESIEPRILVETGVEPCVQGAAPVPDEPRDGRSAAPVEEVRPRSRFLSRIDGEMVWMSCFYGGIAVVFMFFGLCAWFLLAVQTQFVVLHALDAPVHEVDLRSTLSGLEDVRIYELGATRIGIDRGCTNFGLGVGGSFGKDIVDRIRLEGFDIPEGRVNC